jgi:hypothetical protein
MTRWLIGVIIAAALAAIVFSAPFTERKEKDE